LLPQGGTPPIIADVTSRAVLMMHWRWDAIHYYSIATGGYNAYVNQPLPGTEPDMLLAFFPLFPLLIHGVAMLLGGLHSPAFVPIGEAATAPLLAGVLVVNAATLLAFWLLYQLVYEETADDAMAERTVFYVAFFPLAFFYAVPYAEPLFLAASVGTFLAARRRHWVRAGVWIAVAAAARPFGILLGPVLALEMLLAWRRGELPRKDWSRAVLGLIIAPQGLVLFMLYLWWQLGDPFAFVQAQQSFWNREPVFPLVTLWRGIGYTLFPDWSTQPDTYGRTVLHTLTILLFLGGLIISLRRWRPTYVFYGVLLFIQILAVPWPGETVMHTLGRSAMVFFPVYMLLARWGARPAVHQAIMTIWLPLFGLFTAMYVLFYFVG
jgi:Gpi18-like mannosyltransferase